MSDVLTDYLKWFLRQPLALATLAPRTGTTVMDHSSVATLCLHREGQYQVELVLMKPGSPEWPGEHRHPNVDSYEVAVFYPMPFKKNGLLLSGPELVVTVGAIKCDCVRLFPTDWHGALSPPYGAAILSVQKWQNHIVPTSVGLDWDGEPTTEGHKCQLTHNL